jgi:hypothetical protein
MLHYVFKQAVRLIKREASKGVPSAEYVNDLDEEVRRSEAAVGDAEGKSPGKGWPAVLSKVRDALLAVREDALMTTGDGSGDAEVVPSLSADRNKRPRTGGP